MTNSNPEPHANRILPNRYPPTGAPYANPPQSPPSDPRPPRPLPRRRHAIGFIANIGTDGLNLNVNGVYGFTLAFELPLADNEVPANHCATGDQIKARSRRQPEPLTITPAGLAFPSTALRYEDALAALQVGDIATEFCHRCLSLQPPFRYK